MNKEGERFKDNMDFELAMRNLLGKRYYGSAGAFDSAKICKEFLRRAIRRIRGRLNEIITTDERLISTTNAVLDRLERHVKKTSEKVNNDWFIIAGLLNLVSFLLGYDWQDGRVHRHVFFFQSRGQEQQDWNYSVGREYFEEWRKEEKRRYMMVNLLEKNNIPRYQIAILLRIGVRRVNQILRRIDRYEKETGRSFPEFDEC